MIRKELSVTVSTFVEFFRPVDAQYTFFKAPENGEIMSDEENLLYENHELFSVTTLEIQ